MIIGVIGVQVVLPGSYLPEKIYWNVVLKDAQTLRNLNVTYEMIYKKLENLIVLGMRDTSEKLIEGKFRVTLGSSSLGYQICPFSKIHDDNVGPFTIFPLVCSRGNYDVTITNMIINKSIHFSSLLPHLIQVHNFFEGKVKYRLDPEEIVEVLELR